MAVTDGQGRTGSGSAPVLRPPGGWLETLRKCWDQADRDNISVVAAGVAFLALLALFPAMVAGTALYGLVADPQSIDDHLRPVTEFLPPSGRELLFAQLDSLTTQKPGTLGLGLLTSVAVALWSAGGGIRALMRALNIAYDRQEKRGFFAFSVTGLVLTLGLMLLMFVALAIVVAVPAALNFVGLGIAVEWSVRILRWPILALAIITALSVLYQFGPCRPAVAWRWITPGAVAATALWLLGSIGFSIYISNFADYNATYGSLGAGMALLMWMYLGSYAVLLGAELDAQLERQHGRTVADQDPRRLARAVGSATSGSSGQ